MAYSTTEIYYCHNKMCGHQFQVPIWNGRANEKVTCIKCGTLSAKRTPMLGEEEMHKLANSIKTQA